MLLFRSAIFGCLTSFALLASVEPAEQPGDASARPPDGAAPAASVPAADVRDVGPDVYLRDKDGELVFVPDFPFEKYQAYLQQEILGPSAPPPPYSFSDVMVIQGRVVDGFAELNVGISLRLTELREASTSDWVRVALRLNSAILTAPPQHDGKGDVILVAERTGDGYVLWVRKVSGASHRIRLQMRLALSRTGGETRFSLATPRTPNRLELTIDGASVEGRVPNGEESIVRTRHDGKGSVLTVEGTGGMIDVSWREKDETPPVLESSGAITVSLDGEHADCRADLKVRSLGSPVDSFVVRLPAGMDPVPLAQPGYRIVPVHDPAVEGESAEGRQMLVTRLEGMTKSPLEVQVLARRSLDFATKGTALNIAGFEVLNAVRQSGTVDLIPAADWRVVVSAVQSATRVEAPAESARPSGSRLRFEYQRQPFALKVQLQPKASQLKVDPLYLCYVDPDQLRLKATLRCEVKGGRPNEVRVDLSGWTVDRVLPEELIRGPLSLNKVAPLVISLADQEPWMDGELELRIEAHQEITRDQQVISFLPPRVQDGVAAPPTLVVASADNVELIPRTEELVSLIPESPAALASVTDRRQQLLTYREEPSSSRSVFAANFRLRQRSVSVAAETFFKVDEGNVEVEKRLVYQILYEPLREVLLDVPSFLIETGDLGVYLDAKALRTSIQAADAGGLPADRLHVRVELPEPCTGRCVLIVRYRVPVDRLTPNTTAAILVPLVAPHEEPTLTLDHNLLHVSSSGNIGVEIQGADWRTNVNDEHPKVENGGLTAIADGRRSDVPLAVTLLQTPQTPKSVVQREWLQVWVGSGVRRDRAILRLTTSQSRLRIQLPPGARAEDVDVWLNGEPTDRFAASDDRVVVVEMGDASAPRGITVELVYWFATSDSLLGRLVLSAPTVMETDPARWMYWQLVLPESSYLLWYPDAVSREMSWRWQGWCFQRRGDLQQRELEDWVGGSQQDRLPNATNSYLFSSIGSTKPFGVLIARRSVLLSLLSGAALIAGLLLIYLRALRHPAMLFVAGVGLAGFGLVFPDTAILAAQATVAGLALVPLARLLDWGAGRRRARRSSIRGVVFTGPETKAGEPSPRAREGSSRVGTTPLYHVNATGPES